MNRFDVAESTEYADLCLARMVADNASYTLIRGARGDFVGVLAMHDLYSAVRRIYDTEIDMLTTAAVDRRFGFM